MKSVVTLVGPTGAGKTEALRRLADRFPLEVISADSVQAIRGFDVGSAKPTRVERDQIPHHLVDVVDPPERYDAWRFSRDADRILQERQAVPLIVTAGTGFYLQAWSEGLADLPRLDESDRDRLNQSVEEAPRRSHARLARLDPSTAAGIHPNDWRRTARALEIYEATGKQPSDAFTEARHPPGPRLEQYGIWAEGPAYEAALANRIDRMLAAGWIEEVERLREMYGNDLPGLGAVGYRQIVDVLEGNLGREDLASEILLATRRYAKRQRTWFRRRAVRWFPWRADNVDDALLDALSDALSRRMSYNH